MAKPYLNSYQSELAAETLFVLELGEINDNIAAVQNPHGGEKRAGVHALQHIIQLASVVLVLREEHVHGGPLSLERHLQYLRLQLLRYA